MLLASVGKVSGANSHRYQIGHDHQHDHGHQIFSDFPPPHAVETRHGESQRHSPSRSPRSTRPAIDRPQRCPSMQSSQPRSDLLENGTKISNLSVSLLRFYSIRRGSGQDLPSSVRRLFHSGLTTRFGRGQDFVEPLQLPQLMAQLSSTTSRLPGKHETAPGVRSRPRAWPATLSRTAAGPRLDCSDKSNACDQPRRGESLRCERSRSSGVRPRTISKFAESSPIFDPFTGLKSAMSSSRSKRPSPSRTT